MKLKDLLNVLIDGQYIELNYRDKEGYITAYDIPLYRHSDDIPLYRHSEGDINITIYPFLDREIEEVYSNVETFAYEVEYDYLSVVLKREEL